MMSRKHYIKVAKIIKDSTLLYKYRDSNDGRKMLPTINKTLLVSELCTMFKADNNNFDVVRFINACGDDE